MSSQKKSSRLEGKDLITIGIYTVIYVVIVMLVAMLGFIPIFIPLMAVLVLMNVAGVGNMMVPLSVAILCAGALASARLYLGSHNGWQVLGRLR